MKYLKRFNENKMWYKTIPEILEWIESKENLNWIWLDTETTGLGGHKVQQLTQVSAICTKYDFMSNTFNEISIFDDKIKLKKDIKDKYTSNSNLHSRKILSFNHYGSGNYKYKNESDVLDSFLSWLSEYKPALLIAQNASFDMNMISGRSNSKIVDEVFDTKMLIQLYYLPLLQKLSENDIKYKNIVDNIGTSSRDNGLISSSMSKIGPALGINMFGYHDALTDCRITIDMFTRIINFLRENKSVDISKYQYDRIKKS